jgi:hypothetical protein
VRFAEQLRMVRHDGEVERSPQADGAQRNSRTVEWLNADGLAACEAVGVARRVAGALAPRVERERRVDVRIAEERFAKRIVVGARLALLGSGEGKKQGCDDEQDERETSDSASQAQR